MPANGSRDHQPGEETLISLPRCGQMSCSVQHWKAWLRWSKGYGYHGRLEERWAGERRGLREGQVLGKVYKARNVEAKKEQLGWGGDVNSAGKAT